MPQPVLAIQRPRPDQRDGVIETLLVFDEKPVEADAHLARLIASVRALYGQEPPALPLLRDLIFARARGTGLGRMRLTVSPGTTGGFDMSVALTPFEPHDIFPTGSYSSTLTRFTVDEGYGSHKWADRAPLIRAEATAEDGAVPLLVAEDETVFEATRANVFIVEQGELVTPPLDGSILPGVARAAVLELAREWGLPTREEAFDVGALTAAGETFLTGSLRGVEPVTALDAQPLGGEGPVTHDLAAALRERWFGGWLSAF